ncbi:MAG: hypothetical protein AUJ85_01575 [Elusimicrobia bacterium CG1_02_37_114]|nr:MAG: hypothetical protein AUJ85_01575 [Elusimicrobia bacterium CG1_02_37_114]PIV52720.1 MAG: hypothetical protein COS17_07560 [Elusimicrobia bacterium CG02_land_8_20_14_3_00_37_13]PIZ13976.1 MAG: hypothetical protein COY53_01945 [Elusimicrobia bacterium CG_4_10_14_0_8_um_filter_37_32]
MEYKILTPKDIEYPRKLRKILGENCPPNLYYSGPIEFLNSFTISVISADSIGGLAMMATNQVLFTIREYSMNYLTPAHSVMETEIFRLALWKKRINTVSLFSVKGLAVETYESFLLDRFYPPFDSFPERDEYFRRAKNNELLIISLVDPKQTKQLRKNILERNFTICCLGDIIFVPYGPKNSKTYTIAKKAVDLNLPLFTIEHPEAEDLHKLGIPGYNRESVRKLLNEKGAPLMSNTATYTEILNTQITKTVSFVKEAEQPFITFPKTKRKK